MIFSTLSFLCLLTAVTGRLESFEQHVSMPLRRATDDFCTAPVAREAVTFPESLIGRAQPSFGMYSGYVNVTKEDWLFYWFFEAADGNEDAPLVVWTNGGPGCSSMEGATTENGPLVLLNIKEACSSAQCDYTEQLSRNPYAWNAHANVLYVDQPRNVGFSFGYGEASHSSTEAAQDFVTFLTGWYELFPEYKGRDVVISGESYGGHYVPAWADAILSHNEQDADDVIPLKGVIIGNGCINDTVQGTEQYIEFLHASNLIPADSSPRNMAAAEIEMIRYIGYTPNYYDYRVESITCSGCYGYNYSAWAHWFLRDDVTAALNVCGDAGVDAFAGAAGGCIAMPGFDSKDTFDYSAAISRTLEAGIPVTLYFGKSDTACNYVGGYALAESIEWSGRISFNAAPLVPLEISGVEVGQTKTANNLLTWIQVDSAGHMVPIDQPAASAAALYSILEKL